MNDHKMSWIDHIIRFCLENKLIVTIILLMVVGWGILVAPFDWKLSGLPRNPVPVDAIPDIGENQQIVFTDWEGRSPQDVEDQITYPLTVSLLGIPGVKTVRSFSMFGFSTVYIIFKENVEFYWSRSRVLEKLNSLPPGSLPEGVRPMLGPDATALGQVFWYTLEGRDGKGNPTGGWDLHELRSIQDWQVRYALLSAGGVSEVASIGGFVKEYQIDVDPDALRAYRVSIENVTRAVMMSNRDVGARTIEVNRVEYLIRGIGFIKSTADIENAVIRSSDGVPVTVKQVARVTLGPAFRRGILDKGGAEAVGGVVVVRYGENPLAAIRNVKEKIAEISPGLPKKTLPDGTVSQVRIVPFYDRTGLIHETLGTLNSALTEEILVTVIVVLIMVMHFRSSVLISGLLPIAVLMSFIAMKLFGVDANLVALSGIAIAIGTMVDMGIVICENILKHLDAAAPDEDRLEVVFRGASEVGSAVLTAVSTTVVGFLPVFTMTGAEGKLFKPLAFTKTFALISSIIVALTVIPPFAHMLFTGKIRSGAFKRMLHAGTAVFGIYITFTLSRRLGIPVAAFGIFNLLSGRIPSRFLKWGNLFANALAITAVTVVLTGHWLPLGPGRWFPVNLLFVILLVFGLIGFYMIVQRYYGGMLTWCLGHKAVTVSLPLIIISLGLFAWLGFGAFFGWLPGPVQRWGPVSSLNHAFPGLGKEFMPPLDEGSYLFMPTTMPHASIGEAHDILRKQDMAIGSLPEVESTAGKLGRAETPLDPAPVSMIETVINYHPEYLAEESGQHRLFRFDPEHDDFFRTVEGNPVPAPDGEPYMVTGTFIRENGKLIPDPKGKPFRLWRPELDPALNPGRKPWKGIKFPDDIWDEIVKAAEVPGVTSAPRLQPIAARIVMLQSGMRAPMGVKIKGPDLATIEKLGLEIERLLKEVPLIEPSAVIADRIVGKPYLEIRIDREAVARYGIMLENVQDVLETAVGGMPMTSTVEGRERYPVRVRYLRELRDNPDDMGNILVTGMDGIQIPLSQLAKIEYVRGPDMIKSEDTFLTGYVLFDKKPQYAEVDVVEAARDYLEGKVRSGELQMPPGTSYAFAGSYENQVRSQRTLALVLPVALIVIFLILYLQFRTVPVTFLVFTGVFIAAAGGFIMIWLYGQPWFLDFSLFGVNFRELFQVHPINLSVAVWVGFLALFGIASDDGVIQATYLNAVFAREKPQTVPEVRRAALEAGLRRIRPCLMTTATTILALIPVLTSTGRGSDIMVPMAIPSFGGMLIEGISLFIVPVIYAWMQERKLGSNASE
jgi:Cu(I)/Ag(I) efflux system membrane protein CusA/SilA